MDNPFLTLMIILSVAIVAGAMVATQLATGAVRRELRNHLEREGWRSLQELRILFGASGFRGTWQGREAVALYRFYERRHPGLPDIEIEVATRKLEPIHIARRYPGSLGEFLGLDFNLPPRVKLMDDWFSAHARSAETIYEILGDEATALQLKRFLRSPEDQVDTIDSKLRVRRSLRETPGRRFAVTLRPPAGELERSVSLAHRVIESLAAHGF